MKISVSSYSFQQYIGAGKMTQLDTVAKAHELGFEAIEFIDLEPCEKPTLEQQIEYAKLIRAEADKYGMDINAYTIGATMYHDDPADSAKEIERLKGQLLVAKELGAKVMRHDVCYKLGKTGRSRSFDLMLPTIAANIRELTAYAETLGIKTCTENHGYIAQDSDRMERLFNAVDHDNFGLLVDMGNFACVDENSQTAVSRVAPYAVHAHAKDMHLKSAAFTKPDGWGTTRGGNYFKGAIIGEGDIPVKQCVKALNRAGYDGYLSIEYEGAVDCIKGISKGLANLKQILSEV